MALYCFQVGPVVHEIFHSLGSYHEQSRSDRDDYIKINTENIIESFIPINFNTLTSALYGVEYDYYSVMHYGAYVRVGVCIWYICALWGHAYVQQVQQHARYW